MLEASVVANSCESGRLYADVLVPRHLTGPFTYLVPPKLKTSLHVGQLVLVPFGRSVVKGAVIALTKTPPSMLNPGTLKEIRTVVADGQGTEIPPYLLELARKVADSYVAPWGQCLRLVFPHHARSKKEQRRLILTKEGRDALLDKQTEVSALALLRRLRKRPLGLSTSLLMKEQSQEETVRTLLDRRWLQEIVIPSHSRRLQNKPLSGEPPRDVYYAAGESVEREPSSSKEWEAQIVQALENRCPTRLLVEASSADRLSLIRLVVKRTVMMGRKALIIVGESERAQALATMVAPDRTTACLYSAMPDDKKSETWEQIRHDRVSVVVGTRSAVFLPLQNIGLIWIDREEDPALKEPQEPRYHAREVAWMRAQHEQALLVIASSHLTLEARALESQDHLLRTTGRHTDMPTVEVVDIRHDHAVLSAQLIEAVHDTIARRAGVLLYFNRRGYAGALVCKDCGWVPRCSACAVALSYSRQQSVLTCHYCGKTNPLPEVCHECGGSRLQPVGEGTERIEEEVRRRFPTARVLRVDGETMRRPTEAAAVWHQIQRREWDVLVGTQLILRDDVIPPVGLVGVVQADAGLSLPDFRAAERSYHLLCDAIGMAQPRSAGGRMIFQTCLPSHHTIQAVVQQDETIFHAEEMAQRTALGFPPAVHVIVLHISGFQEKTVERAAQAWAAKLSRCAQKPNQNRIDHVKEIDYVEPLVILGPALSPLSRLRGRYRRQILIKSRSRDVAIQHIRATLTELENGYARRVKFDVDIDPVDMW